MTPTQLLATLRDRLDAEVAKPSKPNWLHEAKCRALAGRIHSILNTIQS